MKYIFTSAYVLITLVIKTYMCPRDLISANLCRYHKATKSDSVTVTKL